MFLRIETILKVFRRMLIQLEKLQSRNEKKIQLHLRQQNEAIAAQGELESENERAAKVATKLRELVD